MNEEHTGDFALQFFLLRRGIKGIYRVLCRWRQSPCLSALNPRHGTFEGDTVWNNHQRYENNRSRKLRFYTRHNKPDIGKRPGLEQQVKGSSEANSK